MDELKTIQAQTEADIWNEVNNDFSTGIPANYHVNIHHNNKNIVLNIVSSPGGNEEGGYEYTSLTTSLPAKNDFEFLIQPEDFLNRIGKFFGGQDVVLGYPEFDNNVLVKTNNPERLKALFADEDTRKTFVMLSGYSFGITTDSETQRKVLELHMQHASAGSELRDAYDTFVKVLDILSTTI